MDTVDSADGERGEPPAPLTVRGVPTDPNLRVLALATLVNTLGNGALTTTFALYFTHVVGLRATQVGLALSVAALVGLLVQVPMGHLGDIRGPRELLRLLMIGAGVASLGLLLTDDIWLLVLVLGVQAVFDRGGSAVRSGLIARLAEGGKAVSVQGLPAGGHQRRHLLRCPARRAGAMGGPAVGLPGRLRPQRGQLRCSPRWWSVACRTSSRRRRGRRASRGCRCCATCRTSW